MHSQQQTQNGMYTTLPIAQPLARYRLASITGRGRLTLNSKRFGGHVQDVSSNAAVSWTVTSGRTFI